MGSSARSNSSSRRTRATRLVLLAFALAPVLAVSRLSSDLTSAAENDKTLLWREALWIERLTRARSLAEWLFGGVAVPDNARDLGSFLGTSHNMYVDMLDMYGLVGLALLAIVMVRIWRTPPGWPRWTHLVLAAVFAFGLFYPWPAWSWVVVGFLSASLTLMRHGPRARQSPLAREVGLRGVTSSPSARTPT